MEKKVVIVKGECIGDMMHLRFDDGHNPQSIFIFEGEAKQLQSQLNTLFPDKEVERLRAEMLHMLKTVLGYEGHISELYPDIQNLLNKQP